MTTARPARVWLAAMVALVVVQAVSARAEVVVVVGIDSPIQHMTRRELADVFLGRLNRLPDGAKLLPIDLVDDSPARTALYLDLANMTPEQLRGYWSKLIFTGRGRPPKTVARDDEVLNLVRANPTAIGYLDRRHADASVRILHP